MSGPRYSIFAARAVFDRRLTDATKIVLAALGTFTDGEGWCFPSQKLLAERLGISRPTVSSAIGTLADYGYIEVRPRTAPGRGKVGNEYRVRLDLPDEESPMSVQTDNGKKADVVPDGQRKARKARTRVNVGKPKKPMSSLTDKPMSVQADIAYMEEQSHSQTLPSVESEEQSQAPRVGGDLFGSASPSKPARPKKAPKPVTYSEDFEKVWKLWPTTIRGNSKKAVAWERWRVGCSIHGAQAIHMAAVKYLSETKADDALPGPWKPRTCNVEVFMNGKLEAAVEAAQECATPSLDDGLGRFRASCEFRKTNGRWSERGAAPEEIPHAVRREYPDLFQVGDQP